VGNLKLEGGSWKKTHNGEEYDNYNVPTDWTGFFLEGDGPLPHDPDNEEGYTRPEARVITRVPPYLDPLRISEGQKAWQQFTFYRVHNAGIYQQLTGLPPGAEVTVTAAVMAWSSQDDNPRTSEGVGAEAFATDEGTPGLSADQQNFTFYVGLDPHGGEDPYGEGIVWGTGRHVYNGYADVKATVTVGPEGTVTVFLKSVVKWRFKHNDAHFDNVRVTVHNPSPPPPDPEGRLTLEEVVSLLEEHWPTPVDPPPPPQPGPDEPTVKALSQRDPRWRDKQLGNSSYTLGESGCVVTAVAMFGTQVEPDLTPDVLNDRVRDLGGFTPDGRLYWKKGAESIPGVTWVKYSVWRDGPADVEAVATELSKRPAILQVDFKPATSALDSHFVLALRMSEDGEDVYMIDPWTGKRGYLLEEYANADWDLARAIYAMSVYKLEDPPDPGVEHKPWMREENVIGLHVQSHPEQTAGVGEYLQTAAPRVTKVFDVKDLRYLHVQTPEALLVLRHHKGHEEQQHWLDNPEEGVRRLVDGYARALDAEGVDFRDRVAVESLNEVMQQERVEDAVYFDRLFTEEVERRLAPVAPVTALIAVGNPEPYQYEVLLPLAHDMDAVGGYLGYHSYWAKWGSENLLRSWWEHLAGRWQGMDDYFTSRGAYPYWVFTEIGVVGFQGNADTGDIGLMPATSWRDSRVYGSWEPYQEDLLWWADKVKDWNLTHQNRAVGGTIFTVYDMDWESFAVGASELRKLQRVV
jgi:hypothetical protein